MDFRKSSASGQEGDQSDGREDREGFEQVPAGVVEEENALDANDGPDEQRMRHGGVREGFGGVVDVASEIEPL